MWLILSALLLLATAQLPSTFQDSVDAIVKTSQTDPRGFDRLSLWVDSVGHRLSGSLSLEKGIDWALGAMTEEGFANVHGEAATIPKWVRGEERLDLIAPYPKKLGLLGLGSSVGGNVSGEVLVVNDYTQLNETARGKIVVYNYACDWKSSPDDCYGRIVTYRVDGASKAAKFGALASLCRSPTGYSLYTPHTGDQHYADNVTQIPTACITTEDSDFFQRLQNRGVKIVVSLSMGAENLPPVQSRNIIAEITGSEFPEQLILAGGHVDSWDVGQGAMDDGAGFMVVFEAISLILRSGIPAPRRTIRLIGWVCEEFGGVGAQQYFDSHKAEAANMSFVLESDLGVFQPLGLQFTETNSAALGMMKEIMSYAKAVNASNVIAGGQAEDSDYWINAGVPGGTPYNDASSYFDFHHTNADMISDSVPKDQFEKSAVALAIAIYGVASLPDMLPRDAK